MKQYITSDTVKFAATNLPQLTFEVTDACNLKCKYCAYGEFYDDYDNRENQMLPIEKAVRLIDYLAEFWNSELNTSIGTNVYISFYGGEPLLNMPFIKAIVNHVENKLYCPYRKFLFSMTTNALLLNKYMDFLQEHQFFILVSLDGNRENTSYRINKSGQCAFDRIIGNVDTLRKKYPNYFSERVNFNAVLHNKNSVEEIYYFFKNKYDKIPSIGELNDVGIRKDKIKEFKQTYRNSQESLHQSEHYEEIEQDMFIQTGSYQTVNLFLHQYSGFVFKDYIDLLFDRSKQQKTIPTGTCLPFTKKMYVTVNGKILPCERIGHQFALGEITNTEVKLDMEAIANKYNAYYAKLKNQCAKCRNTKACIQCMFNLVDLYGKPVCHGFMNEESFRNYVNTQMRFLERNPEAYQRLMNEVIVV
jgi:uncharacterized protein